MQTSDAYHTQGIRDFHVTRTEYRGAVVNVQLDLASGKGLKCPCGHKVFEFCVEGSRSVRGLPMGNKHVDFSIPVYRISDCPSCGKSLRAVLPFVDRYARHTRAVERSVVEMRREMSISAVAKFFGLDWRTVKEIEKKYLGRKFRRIRLRDITIIGIDEIHVGKPGYKTIVRDLESGAVVFVGRGKGEDALKRFTRKLSSARTKIQVVAMDMGKAYIKWVRSAPPMKQAKIVFDHFHLIKLMNDKLNKLRRKTMNELDEDMKKELKCKRKLFLRNEEDLDTEDSKELDRIKAIFEDLSTAHAMKEDLRAVYRNAVIKTDAQLLLKEWTKAARDSGIACLKTMAGTIEEHMEGILAYWEFDQLTSAGMEGFNNKIRWLIRQAYGFHDQEYFELKIYDLPTCTIDKQL